MNDDENNCIFYYIKYIDLIFFSLSLFSSCQNIYNDNHIFEEYQIIENVLSLFC
jgi:hypothetical protein